MELFTAGTLVPTLLAEWSGATEKAPKHDEKKVVKAVLDIQLTSEVASALIPTDGEIKNVAFKAAEDGSVRPFVRRVSFECAVPKHNMTVRTTPDAPESLRFEAVRISKVLKLRVDGDTVWLRLNVTIGPLGPNEYASLGMWHSNTRYATFEESAPGLDLDDDEMTDADEKAQGHVIDGRSRPAPERDDDEAASKPADDEKAVEEGHRYKKAAAKPKRGRRKNPADVAKDQIAAGRTAIEQAADDLEDAGHEDMIERVERDDDTFVDEGDDATLE